MKFIKPLWIVTGNYGSGKTEFALNLALRARESGNSVVIADLDIVNPYFRTKDAALRLKQAGVEVVAPAFANTNVEVATLPAEVAKCFTGSFDTAILDVGGDPEGAIALGRYHHDIVKREYEMLFVVNINRPDTRDAASIVQLLREVESASRLNVTALVNNTNLLQLSTAQDLIRAQDVLREVTALTGLPVLYTAGKPEVLEGLDGSAEGEMFPVELFLDLPFERE